MRLIHFNIKGPVAHCGLLVNAGSRDEISDEHGIAHFILRMLFKGTTRRKASDYKSLAKKVIELPTPEAP